MVSVCFVTNELYPLKPGGIGRLMYNFAIDNLEAPAPTDLHYLLPADARDQADAIREAYTGLATVHFCSDELSSLGEFGQYLRQLAESGDPDVPRSSNLDEHLLKSLKYYSGLLAAQAAAGLEFDIIEFPDFGGWAMAAQAAKKAGLAFANTVISVRLHSTFGLITLAERYYHRPSLWLSAIWDMERITLQDADLVVGHLESIADYNARAYRLPDTWRSRVVTEFPPITIDEPVGGPVRMAARRPAQDFIFSSRLQPFKRPDTFVRAAVRLLRDDPGCPSLFHVASYGWDQTYIRWLEALVPPELRLRIRFHPTLTQEERAQLLRRSIVVIPSIYESLCLFAYESAMVGLKVILNRECAAFGEGPRWADGVNCLMFDGNYIDLARVMKAALTWTPTGLVDATPDVPYWESHAPASPPAPAAPGATRLGVLCYGFSTLAEVNQQLLRVADRQADGAREIHEYHAIVPRLLLKEASGAASLPVVRGVQLHPIDSWEVTADDIAATLGQMTAEVVAFAPIDMLVDPIFVDTAVTALAADPDLAVVTSHTLMTGDNLEDTPAKVRLYAGGLLTAAAATTRVCHRASVFRRDVIKAVGLRMDGGDRWFEDLCARMVDAGRRIVCLPAAPVRERSVRPYSRISDELYFSTRANDLGLQLAAPYPLGSLSHTLPGDFRMGDAPIPETRPYRTVGVASWPHANFGKAEITASKGTERDRYRDIKVRVGDLRIKNRGWDSVQFKLAVFNHLPEIILREQKDIIFDAWPPTRSDQWGHLVEYCPKAQEGKGQVVAEALMDLSPEDRYRLGSLVRALATIVKAAEPPKGIDHGSWVSAAEALREHWERDGWE
jgi:glycosyltransferase involved in cell wall biosynthesis